MHFEIRCKIWEKILCKKAIFERKTASERQKTHRVTGGLRCTKLYLLLILRERRLTLSLRHQYLSGCRTASHIRLYL